MTIEVARIILGEEAKNMTDKEIEGDIKSAEFFKDIFFNFKKFDKK